MQVRDNKREEGVQCMDQKRAKHLLKLKILLQFAKEIFVYLLITRFRKREKSLRRFMENIMKFKYNDSHKLKVRSKTW